MYVCVLVNGVEIEGFDQGKDERINYGHYKR